MTIGAAIDLLTDTMCGKEVIWFQIMRKGLNLEALDEIVQVFTHGDVKTVRDLAQSYGKEA